LKAWCASYSKDAVLVLCFEDIQWIDPTSKLLLTQLMEWVKTARVLMVITIRAASGSTADNLLQDAGVITTSPRIAPYITVCEIHELSERETKELMVSVAEGDAMSQSEIDVVANKSEGIPLFVEELTKALLKARESHSEALPAAPILVPDTISDALMAQLDRLGRAKDIAQYASVIGHEFSLDLLAQVTEKSTHELLPDLDRLIESRHVIASESSNMYLFKHALIRDSAYRSLLRKRRQAIHLKIARELTQRASDTTDDLIAQHYAMGEAHSEAVVFWQRAARNAIARSAHEEALRMLDAAIEHLPKLRGWASLALELDLVLAQAMALRSTRGYSAPEVEKRLLKARELCAKCEDSSSRFNVEWGLFQCTIVKGDITSARDIAGNLFNHAASHPDRPFVDAHLGNGMVAFHLGEFQSAQKHFENGVGLSRPEIDRPHFFTHGQNPGIFCLSYLARTELFLGYPDRARSTIQRGLAVASARASDPGHIYTYVNALTFAVRVYQLCGDILFEKQLANEIISIAQRNHYAYYEALGLCHLGWAIGAEGSWSEGIEKMVAGIAAVEQTGTSLALPGFYTYLSQLYIRAGQFDDASRVLENAIDPKHSRTCAWDSEIERVRGDILASRPSPDLEQAESAYCRSVAVARNQGARWLGLRASSNLARLLQRKGRRHEAYAALKAGLEGISEGFDTDEVRTANIALRQLIQHIAVPRTSSPR